MSVSKGRIHSIQSLGTVDGPGLRSVIFLQGCPLRCACCHNPDSWDMNGGEEIEAQALVDRLLAFRPYWRHGGVTASGGEPLLQAEFLADVFESLQKEGVHTALDTSGCLWNPAVERLLEATDLVLLDMKQTSDAAYRDFGAGTIELPLAFLQTCEKRGKPVWIRHVVIPGLNDDEEDLQRLAELLAPYTCIQKVELLAFAKLCLEKYENLGIPFPLQETPAADKDGMARVQGIWSRIYPAEREAT